MSTGSPLIQAVLFDLDGTLVDTEPSAARAITECFERWGIAIAPEDAHYVTGRSWEAAFRYLFAKYPVREDRAEAEALILDRYEQELNTYIHPIPGAVEAVRSMAQELPLALVSGSHRSQIRHALQTLGISDCFRFTLGAEDYPLSKPAPDGYLLAMKKLPSRPEQTLIFEDSQPGIASARAAGAHCVAITAANHCGHDISAAHGQLLDFRGIGVDWIKRWTRSGP